MDISKGFDELQKAANADKDQVKEARDRRDKFKKAFEGQSDVEEVVASGSLARSTQREPINDVDVIIVFKEEDHPDWGADGDSAEDALKYTGSKVNKLLGITNGTVEKLVRLARPRNHAVKCFVDDPDDANAFTVDAMPALRRSDEKGGYLLVPEKLSRKWIKTDPERLIEDVADRQGEWDQFRPLVRVLKLWKDEQDTGLKSLTVEVLALKHLPEEESRPKALQRFFTAAETAIELPIEDPAGRCGEIQPGLDKDKDKARKALKEAASASYKAIHAQDRGDTDEAACLWRKIFGDAFPEPAAGCPTGDGSSAIGEGVSIGGIAGGTVGVDKPRPVTDVPQG